MNIPIKYQFDPLFAKEVTQNKCLGTLKKDFGKALAGAVKTVQQTKQNSVKLTEAVTKRQHADNKLTSGTARQDFKVSAEAELATDQALEKRAVLENQTDAVKVQPLDSKDEVSTVESLTNQPLNSDRESSPVSAQETEEPWLMVILNLLFVIGQLVESPDNAEQATGSISTEMLPAEQVSKAETELMQEVSALLQTISQPEFLLQLTNSLGLEELEIPNTAISELASLTTLPAPVELAEQETAQLNTSPEPPTVASLEVEKSQTLDLPKQTIQLKALMEQLLQGKVTIEAAADAILGTPTLLDQIGLLAKLVNFVPKQELAQKSLQEKVTVVELELEPTTQASGTGKEITSIKPVITKTDTPIILQVPEGLKLTEVQAQNIKTQLQQIKFKIHQQAKTEPGQLEKDGVEDGQTQTVNGSVVMNTVLLIEKALLSDSVLPTSSTGPSFADLQAGASNIKASVTAREVVTQVVYKQIIEQSSLMVGKDHSEVRIQLRPESLGRLSLEIAVEHGVIKAEIIAESQQVKQLLEANLANLKQTLTNQGLKVDQLVVNLAQSQTQFGQSKEQHGQFNRNQRKTKISGDNFEIAEINTDYGGHLIEEEQLVDYKI